MPVAPEMSVILCTAGYDHSIRFWEAWSGICHRQIALNQAWVSAVYCRSHLLTSTCSMALNNAYSALFPQDGSYSFRGPRRVNGTVIRLHPTSGSGRVELILSDKSTE